MTVAQRSEHLWWLFCKDLNNCSPSTLVLPRVQWDQYHGACRRGMQFTGATDDPPQLENSSNTLQTFSNSLMHIQTSMHMDTWNNNHEDKL